MTPAQTAKQRRKWLNETLDEARQIELAEICIKTLEAMRFGTFRNAAIDRLKKEQQRALKAMDKAAEKLGAPYGA